MRDLMRVDKRHPCPICGGISYCSYNASIALCVRVEAGSIKTCQGKADLPMWIHRLGERQVDYTPPSDHEGCIIANPEERDKVYRAFLSQLGLASGHRQNLRERGFSDHVIRDSFYKTVPLRGRSKICEKLVQKGYALAGIPGFYQKDGQNGKPYWTFVGRSGIFIPVINECGQIVGLRIRLDEPDIDEDGKIQNKYHWFSSLKKFLGTGSGAPLHIEKGLSDIYWFTEGEFKAKAIRLITGHNVISVPGVNCWLDAVSYILKKGIRKVIVAYDMDKYENDKVMTAEKNLIRALVAGGIQVAVAEWDIRRGKGIDDLLIHGGKPSYAKAS